SAADNQWIPNYSSMLYQRYQVCATDTSETPAKKAYAYIYHSTTLTRLFTPYMQYIAPATGSSDTVKSMQYIFAHNENSIPSHLQIHNGMAYGQDILDRWKIRFDGNLLGFNPYSETEDSALEDTLLHVRAGPVRIIRESVFKLFLAGKPAGKLLAMTTFFYPQIARINLIDEDLPSWMGVTKLRQSVDYNACVDGGYFHWTGETDIPVDGLNDALDNCTMSVPGINWYLLQSNCGTVATVVENDAIPHTTQYLFYIDDSSTTNGAMRGDTGDIMAYGESGVQLNADPGSSIEVMDECVYATFYYLGAYHTSDYGDTLSNHVANPLHIMVIPRTNEVIPVELASFQAIPVQDGVRLSWQTASESNNYGFQIQRRISRADSWQIIGFVEGYGTSSDAHNYTFVDKQPVEGINHYRLCQLDTDGALDYSQEVSVTVQAPRHLELRQNYPNPFNPDTEIGFYISRTVEGNATLHIYNLLGQNIRTLVDETASAGYHRIRWDGCDEYGRQVGSGIYLYRLKVGEQVKVRKMIKAQ
ncbi:T9SS type A sorting domain-containing protein, partial [candidate division KSB1 bacterium]|nr:T9SS type A sorting domain-containing protein [candidate division KSB1 bacterium]